MIGLYIALAIIGGFAAGFLLQRAFSQKEIELLKQQQEQIKSLKEESLQATKAAALEVSQSLSAQLIAIHKQENEQSKKQAEEITKRETDSVHKEFKAVVEKLGAISGQNQLQEKKLAAIWQSLTAPVKASNFAEIGLENTLKNFGLEHGRDFSMQSTIDGTRLRPDAIIYLPAGNQVLIDAKTSKYFIELAQAEADEAALKEKLKQSMHTHLQGLISRDYAGAAKNSSSNIVNVIVLYLPNDSAYSRVIECDPSFEQKCRDNGVILATPASLQMLLTIATHHISRARQEHNYQQILKEMGKVISSLDILFRGIADVGLKIKQSAESFAKVGSTINSRLLGRVKKIVEMGVEPENALKLPDNIPTITVTENLSATEYTEYDEPKIALIK